MSATTKKKNSDTLSAKAGARKLSDKWGTRQFPNKAERLAAQTRFLEAFAQSAFKVVGCRAAGVTRQTVDYWLEHDEEFSFCYHIAKEEAKDRINAEIQRRAMHGVTRTKGVYYQGQLVGTDEITEYSDGLLLGMAKMLMEEWRNLDSKREISGPDGAPIEMQRSFVFVLDGEKKTVEQMTPEQLDAMEASLLGTAADSETAGA